MDGAGASPSSTTLLRALAAALGQLKRSPGRDEAWVEAVLRAIERDQPDRYLRLRRRLGFAQRLGDLAQLRVEEQAILAIGILSYELMGDRPPRNPPASGPWVDYLSRNSHWLGPSLRVCEAIGAFGWEAVESRPALIARFVVTFDKRTLEELERPIQVLQALIASAQASPVEQITPLLWSEDGQALCDFHFRRHADGYRLDVHDVRRSLELLKHVLPAPALSETSAPAPRPVERKAAKAAPREGVRATASVNFERRREALRSSSTKAGLLSNDGGSAARGEVPAANVDDAAPAEAEEDNAAATRPSERPSVVMHEINATQSRQEELMDRLQMSAPPDGQRETFDLVKRLETIGAELDQIQRLASDAQALLRDVAPQVQELASWVAELETVVSRWKARAGPSERVA